MKIENIGVQTNGTKQSYEIVQLFKRLGVDTSTLIGNATEIFFYHVGANNILSCDRQLPNNEKAISFKQLQNLADGGELIETFTRGEIVMAKETDFSRPQKRIYITTIDGAKNHIVCVHIDDEESFLKGETFRTFQWHSCEKITKPIWKEKEIKLSSEYTAIVKAESVKVGCQEFTFELMEKVYNVIMEAKEFAKNNKTK